MQPYRVLAHNGIYITVYAAMLSVKDDGTRKIYIVEKHLPEVPAGQMSFLEDEELETARELAHKMSTVRNSDIVGSYDLVKYDTTPIEYSIHRVDDRIHTPTDVLEKTQQDCLRMAMGDFCRLNNYEILNVL